MAVKYKDGEHGKECPKIEHIGGGYLHAANDDTAYDVDGIAYCGRCHCWLGKVWTDAELDSHESILL